MVMSAFPSVLAGLVLMFAGAGPAAAWCVRGVEGWDTLRMRMGPSPAAREIGRIPPAACGVAIVGACRGPWCPVQWQGRVGWSNAIYLERGGIVDFLVTPRQTLPPPRMNYAEPWRRPVRTRTAAAPPPRAPRLAAAPSRQRLPQRIAAVTAPAPISAVRPVPPVRAEPEAFQPAPPPIVAAPPAPPPTPPAAPVRTPPPAPIPVPAPAVLSPAPPAAAATPPAQDAAREVCIVDIAKGETLRVRAGPSTDQPLRYGYPAGACGVRITGTCANGWCPVDYRGYRGWAEQRFLK